MRCFKVDFLQSFMEKRQNLALGPAEYSASNSNIPGVV